MTSVPNVPLEPWVPLVATGDLNGFSGGPFVAAVVDSSADSIRDECGWHIAPTVTTTVRFRGRGLTKVLLPTLRLVELVSVVDGDGNPVTDVEFYDHGVIEREAGFPKWVTVTFTHGFSEAPKALLPIIAERASAGSNGRIKSEALAGRSVSLEGGYDPISTRVLNAYKLQRGA